MCAAKPIRRRAARGTTQRRRPAILAACVAVALSATPAQAAWDGNAGNGFASITARAADAPITAEMSCTVGGVSQIILSGYDGDQQTDPRVGRLERVYLVTDGAGGSRAFALGLYYGDIDNVFASDGRLDPAFLAAWSAGRTMTLHKGDGTPVATWPLTGTARALRRMERACGTTVLGRGLAMEVPVGEVTGGPRPTPAAISDVDVAVVEAQVRAELAGLCAGEPLAIGADAIRVADVTGDGAPDAIVSFETITCAGRLDYCGAQVCSLRIYVKDGGSVRQALDILSTAPTIGSGSPPPIEGQGHGGRPWSLRWNGANFEAPY